MLNKRTGTIHPYLYGLNYGRPLVGRAGKGLDIGQPSSISVVSTRFGCFRRAIISRTISNVNVFFGTRARGNHIEATLNHPFPAQVALRLVAHDLPRARLASASS